MPKSKKTRYHTPLKKNMTVKEASDYWDKHTFFDFGDITEVDFDIVLEGEKHYILLDRDVAKQVESLAKKKKQPQRVIVNSLLKKSLVSS